MDPQKYVKNSLFGSDRFDLQKYEEEMKFDIGLLTEKFQIKPRAKKPKKSKKGSTKRKKKRKKAHAMYVDRWNFLKYIDMNPAAMEHKEGDEMEDMDRAYLRVRMALNSGKLRRLENTAENIRDTILTLGMQRKEALVPLTTVQQHILSKDGDDRMEEIQHEFSSVGTIEVDSERSTWLKISIPSYMPVVSALYRLEKSLGVLMATEEIKQIRSYTEIVRDEQKMDDQVWQCDYDFFRFN